MSELRSFLDVSNLESIPDKWIRDYVDRLIELAKELGPDTPMGKEAAERAGHIMDMVSEWRNQRGGR